MGKPLCPEDCDDTNADLRNQLEDTDCDGVLIVDDCDDNDLPEMIYDHTYSFLFNSKKDYDSAVKTLCSSSLFTEGSYSLLDQDETNNSKPWRSPERQRD